jgi:hypothetical protein
VAADLIDDLLEATAAEAQAGDAGEVEPGEATVCGAGTAGKDEPLAERTDGAAVYGDAAYGAGEFLDRLEEAGIEPNCKTQPPANSSGLFSKDEFAIDLDTDTVTCPAGHQADIDRDRHGDGVASFGGVCTDCPMRAWCTNAAGGRTIRVGRHEAAVADARERQRDPAWVADYRATRPKVERKIGHLMRRQHGGRRARVRGRVKVDADFNLLAAAVNFARLAALGLHSRPAGWAANVTAR